MINCVYRIKFLNSSDELNDEYDNMSDDEKDIISNLDAESFFDYEDDYERYTCYLITTSNELKKYSEVLLNNNLKHDISDISDNVLRSKIDLEALLETKISEHNSYKYDFFIDDLYDWIYQNLDIDIVLDRISEVGMNLLTEVELQYLKDYSV